MKSTSGLLKKYIRISVFSAASLFGVLVLPVSAAELHVLQNHELDSVRAGNADAVADAVAHALGDRSSARTSTRVSADTFSRKHGSLSGAKASGAALACCEAASAEVNVSVIVSGKIISSHTSYKISVNNRTGKVYARGYSSALAKY